MKKLLKALPRVAKYFRGPKGVIFKHEEKWYRIGALLKEILAMLAILLVLSGSVYLFVYGLVIYWIQ